MWTSLIYLDEDLPSSMALRFAAEQGNRTKGRLQVLHAQDPGSKAVPGAGWVRRSWEEGLLKAGTDDVNRLLKTEKVDCPHAGAPRVVIGTRDEAVVEELRRRNYDLYIEGYLNTSNTDDFFHLLDRPRFRDTKVPVMLVKNLVPVHNILMLAAESVPFEVVLPCFSKIYDDLDGSPDITLLYYRFAEEKELLFLDQAEAGSYLNRAGRLLSEAGREDVEFQVVQGTPEQAALYMRNYGLVVSTFPTRRSPRAELLALLSNPLLLCRNKTPGTGREVLR